MDMVERIIWLSEQKNISGVELGKMLGLAKSPLTDWKNNKSKPTINQLITLCEIFATTTDYIIFGTTPTNTDTTLNELDQELLETYHSLDKRGQHKIHTLIYEELDRIKTETQNVDKKNFQTDTEANHSISKMARNNNLVRK